VAKARLCCLPFREEYDAVGDLNHWAILLAALSSFLLGGVWYGPLFKDRWCAAAGVDPDSKPRHPARVFGGAFVLSLVAATFYAWFLGPHPDPAFAIGMGALIGVCWVSTSFGINYLFAARPLVLWAIDGGYHVLQFVLYGVILSLWR
jgi:hypothetical protein